MNAFSQAGRSTAVVLMTLSLLPSALRAQGRVPTVGVVGGTTRTQQIWGRSADAGTVDGLLLGAWVDAPTPSTWLSIRAEGAFTQRGGDVTSEVGGQVATGGIRSDYLTISVQARGQLRLGRLHLHSVAGPVVDKLLRSRLDPMLTQVLDREVPTVLGVGAGVGVGARVTERVVVELELRIFEGLGGAYTGNFQSVRNRSTEIVGRLGIPLRR
jgi:hypothetical protein